MRFLFHGFMPDGDGDLVLVPLMDGGRIVEAGSHDELMRIRGGHYRELFDMQAKYYTEKQAA